MSKKFLIVLTALALSFISSFLINISFVNNSDASGVWPILLLLSVIISAIFLGLYFLIDKIASSTLLYTFAMAAVLLVSSVLTDTAYVYVQNHTDWLAINNGSVHLTTLQKWIHSDIFFYAKYMLVLLLHFIARFNAKSHKNV